MWLCGKLRVPLHTASPILGVECAILAPPLTRLVDREVLTIAMGRAVLERCTTPGWDGLELSAPFQF